MARRPLTAATWRAKTLGLVGSIVLHGAVVALSLAIAKSAPAQAPVDELYPIDIEPIALGIPEGKQDGTGTPNVGESPSPATEKAPEPEPAEQAPVPDEQPAEQAPEEKAPTPKEQAPVLTADKGAPTTEKAPGEKQPTPAEQAAVDKEREREELREAVRKAMLAPPDSEGATSPVAGTGTAAPLGSPDGVPGGKPKPRVSAKYASVLDGWFSARMSLRGLDLPWEELKLLKATVSISLTPDRHVSSFSMAGSSGNAAYDAKVRASMTAIVSSGATLPAPPDDDEVPTSITLVFRCRSQDSCS